jgi:hypothetical protein
MLRGRAYFCRKILALERWVAFQGFCVFAGVFEGFWGKVVFQDGFFVDSAW